MKSLKGTPVGHAGRGRWGCMKLLMGIAIIQIFHNKGFGVSGDLMGQIYAKESLGQGQVNPKIKKVTENYFAALAKEFGDNCDFYHGSDGGDSSNKDHRLQRRIRHMDQSRRIRFNNNARRSQQRATTWRDSQAE